MTKMGSPVLDKDKWQSWEIPQDIVRAVSHQCKQGRIWKHDSRPRLFPREERKEAGTSSTVMFPSTRNCKEPEDEPPTVHLSSGLSSWAVSTLGLALHISGRLGEVKMCSICKP